jgi:hypothetical protein
VTAPVQPRLVDEHAASAILGLGVTTLRRWRWARREVPFVKLGGAVRYDVADLQAYIDGHRQGSTTNPIPGMGNDRWVCQPITPA